MPWARSNARCRPSSPHNTSTTSTRRHCPCTHHHLHRHYPRTSSPWRSPIPMGCPALPRPPPCYPQPMFPSTSSVFFCHRRHQFQHEPSAPRGRTVPQPPPDADSTGVVVAHGGPLMAGTLYGGIDSTLFHGASPSIGVGRWHPIPWCLTISRQCFGGCGSYRRSEPPSANSTGWSSRRIMRH